MKFKVGDVIVYKESGNLFDIIDDRGEFILIVRKRDNQYFTYYKHHVDENYVLYKSIDRNNKLNEIGI